MSYQTELEAAAALATKASNRADAASLIFHKVAHGLQDELVTTENGDVQTLAGALKQLKEADFSKYDPATAFDGTELFWVKQGGKNVKVLVSDIKLVDSVNGKTGAVVLNSADVGAVPTTEKGAVNGVATLDAGGFVPNGQIPELAVTNTYTALDQASMLALNVSQGDFAERSDTGTVFLFKGGDSTLLANWREFSSEGAAVKSVNSKTGTVVLNTDDIAQGTNNKYYPSADSTKLAGIESGAQVNTVTSVNTKTGAVSLGAADVSAVPSADKGVANGVASLGADGIVPAAQLPPSGISDAPVDGILYGRKDGAWAQVPSGGGSGGGVALFGSELVGQGKTEVYNITNYNSFSDYTVSATAGTASISGSDITYTAPGTGTSDTLTVTQDGTSYNFVITLNAVGIQGTYTQLMGGATARHFSSATVVSGSLYVFGGDTASGDVNDLWRYDPTANAWTQLTSGATARDRMGLTSSGGIIYMYGGLVPGYSTDLWKYDPATDTWTDITPATSPPARSTMSLVAISGSLYMFGGDASTGRLNDLWKYDIAAGTWTQLTSGATTRRYHSAVAVDGIMYVTAGEGLSDHWKYDPATDTWTQLASLPATLYAHSAAVVDGSIFTFAGLEANNYANNLYKYDVAANTWTKLTAGATARGYHVGQAIAGSKYIFGGFDGAGRLNDLWRID